MRVRLLCASMKQRTTKQSDLSIYLLDNDWYAIVAFPFIRSPFSSEAYILICSGVKTSDVLKSDSGGMPALFSAHGSWLFVIKRILFRRIAKIQILHVITKMNRNNHASAVSLNPLLGTRGSATDACRIERSEM